MSGDSAKSQLKLVEDQLLKTEKKVELKDTVISLLRIKESNYNVIIDAQNQKYSTLETHTKKVELDLKKEKVKNKFTSVLSGVAVAALTFFLIIK